MTSKGSSQPSLQQAYTTAGNPAQQDPAESRATKATQEANKESADVDKRKPDQGAPVEEATPSSLGRGVRGAGPGEEAKGYTQEDFGELNGEQMRAPGEGETADAVAKKPGASGAEGDLASDLDKKKAEQAPMREKMKQSRADNVDVGGVLGQRGGPADPTQ